MASLPTGEVLLLLPILPTDEVLLLHGVCDEEVHVLPLIQQKHGSEVAHTLVRETVGGYQL